MKTLTATVVTVTMAMSAGQTMAAAAAAAPAAPAAVAPAPTSLNITHGAPITGICLLSNIAVQSTSAFGKGIDKQLNTIATQTNNELAGLKNAIDQEAATLDKNKATMQPLQYNQQMLTLQDKFNNFQALAGQRQQEMDLTEQQQNQAFGIELQTIATKIYQDQKCSLLIDRDASIMLYNPAMDISDLVTKAMDKDKSVVAPFTRATLPAQPVGTAAAGAAR